MSFTSLRLTSRFLGSYLMVLAGVVGCVHAGCAHATPQRKDMDKDGLIRSDFSAGELAGLCKKSLAEARSRFDGIVKLDPAARNFDNTVLAFELIQADLQEETTPLTFMKEVSPDEKIHSEGAQCEVELGEFLTQTYGRRDLYLTIKDQKPRGQEEARLLTKTLESFESNGLKLPDEQLAKVTALFSRLSKLESHFSEHLSSDNSFVELTAEELQGVSSDFLSRLKKTEDGKKYIVTTKITDYEEVMEKATSELTRQKMLFVYNNRQADTNTPLLEEAIEVRKQIASLMGYPTWADYRMSHGRMAKNSKSVLDFLNGLKDRLAERNRLDLAQLLSFKKTLNPSATEVKAWDLSYLSYQLRKRDFSLDDEKIKEYFPAQKVIQGVFEIYSQLFGVSFELVSGGAVWSPDVQLYRVLDQKDRRLIGYFYTDFIPRPNKYEHFAAFTLRGGRLAPEGYLHPVSAIVGNFSPPAGGKPSLLTHEEVVTLFHEFGHIMHQTLTRAPFASLSGSSVAQDFVEAPSQMLENWTWEAKVLNLLSGHYLNSAQKLPDALLKQMIAAREFQQGYAYTRQLVLALTDMDYHTSAGPVDTAAVYSRRYRELIGVAPIEGGHFPASFGHLMGGYDAGYYGYLWSEVFSLDMYTQFQKTDVFSADTGGRYRRFILEKGDMEDPQDLLTQFLGRAPNSEAFFKKLHQ